MAPRGPDKPNIKTTKSRSQTDNQPNKKAGSSKTGSNGGVKKPRGRANGATRTDRDGDLNMGAVPESNTKGAQNNDRRNDGKGTRNKGGWILVRVHGLKESKLGADKHGVTKLLTWIEKKGSERSKGKVRILKNWHLGDDVIIKVPKVQSEAILNLNGFSFAGGKMEITQHDDDEEGGVGQASKNPVTSEVRNTLQTVLGSRYSAEHKLLNLESLATDAELVNLGAFNTRELAMKTFTGLMVVCDGIFKTAKDKQNAIESISLANNSIVDVKEVESVATTFPHLKNLDMRKNSVASFTALASWRGKFRYLEAILLDENPIVAAEPTYQTTLLNWFPRLQNINGIQVRTKEEVERLAALPMEKAIPQNGFDFRDINNIAENFLVEFFAAYDQDRQALAARLYDDTSRFSIAVDTGSVIDASSPAPLPWSTYLRASRNLAKVTVPNSRVQRLYTGAAVITELWRTLPATVHPSIKDETSKYIMDCHPTPGLVDPNGQVPAGVDGLVLTIHGQFQEHDAQASITGLRSFSRMFLLGPGLPGKGPLRVISDMLSLRAFSALPDVFAKPNGQTQGIAPPPQDPREIMISELCAQTGMTRQYSVMCLEGVNGDYNKALIAFNEQKAQLPPEAFVK